VGATDDVWDFPQNPPAVPRSAGNGIVDHNSLTIRRFERKRGGFQVSPLNAQLLARRVGQCVSETQPKASIRSRPPGAVKFEANDVSLISVHQSYGLAIFVGSEADWALARLPLEVIWRTVTSLGVLLVEMDATASSTELESRSTMNTVSVRDEAAKVQHKQASASGVPPVNSNRAVLGGKRLRSFAIPVVFLVPFDRRPVR